MRLNPAGFNTPDRYSLFGKKIEGSVLSTVKKAEREEALLIRIYNPNINKNNAQLIFNTHEISLLDLNLFRRDQIYFVEKNSKGEPAIKILDTKAQKLNTADIGIIPKKNILLVPTFFGNKVVAYKIDYK